LQNLRARDLRVRSDESRARAGLLRVGSERRT
jgi:hypothetical protein